jgi:sulfate/thiosulfate transport system substrate-binding protein
MTISRGWASLALGVMSLSLGACRSQKTSGDKTVASTSEAKRVRTLTVGAYTTPREPYGKAILPAFQKKWQAEKGETIKFEESYLGSGAQARAIVGGFEADVAALSLEADIKKISDAGLITSDWKATPTKGMVTRSIVVIGVRPGNAKGIKDWADLAKPGIKVLTPNVRTSGGAMWNILAIWGAALRGKAGVKAGDQAAAVALLGQIIKNVPIMDKGARESMLTFENGIGDAIITYENEILVAKKSGKAYDYVVPTSTILIENPVAVVDKFATRRQNMDLAQAFVAYLITKPAQEAFASFGYRPVDLDVEKAIAGQFPTVADLFTIADVGGWSSVDKVVFGPDGAYDKATAAAGQGK